MTCLGTSTLQHHVIILLSFFIVMSSLFNPSFVCRYTEHVYYFDAMLTQEYLKGLSVLYVLKTLDLLCLLFWREILAVF